MSAEFSDVERFLGAGLRKSALGVAARGTTGAERTMTNVRQIIE
jgi:hypothetical protein